MNRTILMVGVLGISTSPLAAQVARLDDSTVARLDDATAARLAKVVDDQPMMRVHTIWGPFDLAAPTLTATGVGYGSVLNERLFLPDSVPFPDAVPIGWISQMQIRHRDVTRGMLTGGAVFALVGFAFGAVVSKGAEDGEEILFTSRQGGLGFGVFGLLIGAATSKEDWKTIYPESAAPPGRP